MSLYPNSGIYTNNGIYQNNGIYSNNGLYGSALPALSSLNAFPKINNFWDTSKYSDGSITSDLSSALLHQPTLAQQPSVSGDYLDTGNDPSLDIGLISQSAISFVEVFIIASYKRTTFNGNATLWSGSAQFTGEKRIAGIPDAVDLRDSASIDVSGRVRINNSSESRLGVLPALNEISVIHAANFSGATTVNDIISVGYSHAVPGRGWECLLGGVLTTSAALTEADRAEISNWLQIRISTMSGA